MYIAMHIAINFSACLTSIATTDVDSLIMLLFGGTEYTHEYGRYTDTACKKVITAVIYEYIDSFLYCC